MALINLRQLLDHAAENQYGVPASILTIWNKAWHTQGR